MVDEIWALRRRAGMTQAELAERLSVGSATVANWERSRAEPSARQWLALAAIFDVDPRQIILPFDAKAKPDDND
jgi:transcriptional regulator with XRE-family HTH domain